MTTVRDIFALPFTLPFFSITSDAAMGTGIFRWETTGLAYIFDSDAPSPTGAERCVFIAYRAACPRSFRVHDRRVGEGIRRNAAYETPVDSISTPTCATLEPVFGSAIATTDRSP